MTDFPGLSKQSWPRENSADLDAFYGHPVPSGTNLVAVTIPWQCNEQHIQVNEKVAASVERVLNAYWDFVGRDQSRIDAHHLNICDGAFNYRANKNNPSVLSMHSYGIAIDWAAAYNPNGSAWHDGGSMLPVEFLEAWQAEGWSLGALFHGTKDPMHVEATNLGQGPIVGGDELPLQFGSIGPLVIQIQTKFGITADGVFGHETEDSVKAFQTAHGLEVDGIVGDATWAALQSPVQLTGGAAICRKLLDKFGASSVVGVVPSDGAQFGITTGSALQWAIFATAVCDAESGFNPRSANTSDPGGSFGIFQYAHSQVPGGNAFDIDASVSAFVRDAEASMHNLRGGILGKRFSTIGSHPDRTIAKLGEAAKLAASIPAPVPPAPIPAPVPVPLPPLGGDVAAQIKAIIDAEISKVLLGLLDEINSVIKARITMPAPVPVPVAPAKPEPKGHVMGGPFTTTFGGLTIVGAIGALLTSLSKGTIDSTALMQIITSVISGVGLIFAKDHNVTGGTKPQ